MMLQNMRNAEQFKEGRTCNIFTIYFCPKERYLGSKTIFPKVYNFLKTYSTYPEKKTF